MPSRAQKLALLAGLLVLMTAAVVAVALQGPGAPPATARGEDAKDAHAMDEDAQCAHMPEHCSGGGPVHDG